MNMLARCSNPKAPNYEYYGGRGIVVCERWLRFENFLADMGARPERCTIDRIDNDQGYEPSNCRWASRRQQVSNRTTTLLDLDKVSEIRRLSAAGRPNAAIARIFNVDRSVISKIVHGRSWRASP